MRDIAANVPGHAFITPYSCGVNAMPARPERDLRPEDRQRLDDALHRLRVAVEAYEQFLGAELAPGQAVRMHDAREMASAQAAIESADEELWKLREALLGWTRPSWARALSVTDWFSEEDAVYDDLPITPTE